MHEWWILANLTTFVPHTSHSANVVVPVEAETPTQSHCRPQARSHCDGIKLHTNEKWPFRLRTRYQRVPSAGSSPEMIHKLYRHLIDQEVPPRPHRRLLALHHHRPLSLRISASPPTQGLLDHKTKLVDCAIQPWWSGRRISCATTRLSWLNSVAAYPVIALPPSRPQSSLMPFSPYLIPPARNWGS